MEKQKRTLINVGGFFFVCAVSDVIQLIVAWMDGSLNVSASVEGASEATANVAVTMVVLSAIGVIDAISSVAQGTERWHTIVSLIATRLYVKSVTARKA